MLTYLVIIANAIISLKGFKEYSFFEKYKFNMNNVLKGEFYRIISSSFLHVDYTHLIFNMLTLYFFGPYVNNYLGSLGFIFIYLASVITGNLYTIYSHKKELMYNAVGASGGVMGIIFSAVMVYPDMKLYLFFIPIGIPGYIYAILFLLYSFYGMKNSVGNIGHAAHIGGAVGGLVLTLVLKPFLLIDNFLFVLILGGIIIAAVYFMKRK